MKTMNKTQLIGYLGRDPQIKESKSGNIYAVLNLATHSKRKNPPADSADPFYTTWHTVRFWEDAQVEQVNKLMKGSHIMVEGKITYRSFIDNKGVQRSVAEIKGYSITDLDR